MDFISPKITGPSEEGSVKIKSFAINNKDDAKEYERIQNDPQITVLDEHNPTLDRAGRMHIVVKWKEPV